MKHTRIQKRLRVLAHWVLVLVLLCTAGASHAASGCDMASPCRTAAPGEAAACTCGGGEGGCCSTASTEAASCCASEDVAPVQQEPSAGCCSTKSSTHSGESPCSTSAGSCPCSVSTPDTPAVPVRSSSPLPLGKQQADELPVLALVELAPLFGIQADSGTAMPDIVPSPISPRLDVLCRYLC